MNYTEARRLLGFEFEHSEGNNGLLFCDNFDGGCVIVGPNHVRLRIVKNKILTKKQQEQVRELAESNKEIWMGLSREVVQTVRRFLPQPIYEEIEQISTFGKWPYEVRLRAVVVPCQNGKLYFNEQYACLYGTHGSYTGPRYRRFKIAHTGEDTIIDGPDGITHYL